MEVCEGAACELSERRVVVVEELLERLERAVCVEMLARLEAEAGDVLQRRRRVHVRRVRRVQVRGDRVEAAAAHHGVERVGGARLEYLGDDVADD